MLAATEPTTTSLAPARSGPIVVMDEPKRAQEIYGASLNQLARPVVFALRSTVEEILACQPAALLLSCEWILEWRLVSAAMRKAGIPVIYVMDGVVEWSFLWNNLSFVRPSGTMLQPLIGSDLCVIGQHQARILSTMGLATRIHIVGVPRFDSMSRERIVKHGALPRIVIATARTAGHNVEQEVYTLRALRDLQAWFRNRPDIEVVWRIAGDLAENIGVIPDIRGGMSDVLATASALISFTSTCLLEAMHKGIPAAQVDYRPSPIYVATAWEIRSAEHISSVVQELLYPPPAKLAWQDACLADELEPGNAAEKLAATIRDIVNGAHGETKDESIQSARIMGRIDYRQIYSELSAFAISDASTLQYELSAIYQTLRQTKLEKGAVQRECIELAEAFSSCDVTNIRSYSCVERFGDGKFDTHLPAPPSVLFCNVDRRAVRAISMPIPTEITFAVPTGSGGTFSFAIALHPNVWTNPKSGPCRFIVSVDNKRLFDATVEMKTDPSDRKWWWFNVAVPENRTGSHSITLTSEAVGGKDMRWAVWRTPTFLWIDAQPAGKDSFVPRMASTFDFYLPGATIPV